MNRIFIIISLFIVLFSACNSTSTSEKNTITVSILPQKYFVEIIAGDEFEINVLIPPGASPASYEPTPVQIEKLGKSMAYFRIGHIGFEQAWSKRIANANPNIPVYNLSESCSLIKNEEDHHHHDHNHEPHGHSHGAFDPHIWLSLVESKTIIKNTTEALSKVNPTNKQLYATNAKQLITKIDSLHAHFSEQFETVNNRNFLIFHPALTYFARDYNLTQIAIENEGKDPSPKHMKNVIDLARNENIKVIFIQKEFDIENAEIVAKEVNAKVIQINPLNENWFDNISEIGESVLSELNN